MPGRISIRGDHARVKTLSRRRHSRLGFDPEPRIVQRKSKKILVRSYSVAMALAHILYPENFPKLVASSLDRKTTFSEQVQTNKNSHKAVKSFYRRLPYRKALDSVFPRLRVLKDLKYNPRKYRAHEEKVKQNAIPLADEVLSESGIEINPKAMNIGFAKNGSPVFFEITGIYPKVLRKKIESMQESLEKKQAMQLLEAIEAEAKGNVLIFVH
ncbi:MAG: hypothetical protein PHD95_04060 [Candidatus ainarchaeum sp.]|nr:hypothetical protein [Candidatus ainarchaeum sp.]